ncbi:DUF1810 domain-containing protein [Sphingomonas sp. 3-13AW]|uniref:DUF1810 domain-containing protein n=1 Tax=Sphingomonas sp. 3-13AW TaxID=3050450 RepID=UPI003BB76802
MAALDRFVEAQDPVWGSVLAELRRGRKTSHWMWFVFPQIAGLGRTDTARFFAIADAAEARAYLAHPVLGPRLREAATALLAHRGQSAEAILGGIDAIKLRSAMTLFDAVAPGGVFAEVLDAFYGGVRDPETLRRLG